MRTSLSLCGFLLLPLLLLLSTFNFLLFSSFSFTSTFTYARCVYWCRMLKLYNDNTTMLLKYVHLWRTGDGDVRALFFLLLLAFSYVKINRIYFPYSYFWYFFLFCHSSKIVFWTWNLVYRFSLSKRDSLAVYEYVIVPFFFSLICFASSLYVHVSCTAERWLVSFFFLFFCVHACLFITWS